MIKRNKLGQFIKGNDSGIRFGEGQKGHNMLHTKEAKKKILKTAFKKGHIPWCKDKKLTEKHKEKLRGLRPKAQGEKNHNWKGDEIGYGAIHVWLKVTFGKANKCENTECPNRSKIYDWALLKGKEYERKRENFIQLCRGCHIVYDRKPYPIRFSEK